jgi:hypothetical protein
MNEQTVNRLTKKLVAICTLENPDLDETQLKIDAKNAVIESLTGPEFALRLFSKSEELNLLVAKLILSNSKRGNFSDSLFGKIN